MKTNRHNSCDMYNQVIHVQRVEVPYILACKSTNFCPEGRGWGQLNAGHKKLCRSMICAICNVKLSHTAESSPLSRQM